MNVWDIPPPPFRKPTDQTCNFNAFFSSLSCDGQTGYQFSLMQRQRADFISR
jgi:hypothetical protein